MLSPEASAILKARYLLDGETPTEMFMRAAKHVAQAETLYGADAQAAAKAYYQLMANLEFLPNSPTLINAGKPGAQLAACFVLPIEDSLAGIFETLKEAALIQQSGGGTGFSFSRLRPRGDLVAATGNSAGGPVSFMQVYNAATEAVKQGAVRSGANMAVLRVDHPDIREFIEVKRQRDVLNNFNLSVAITDKFMAAVADGGLFDLINPRTGGVAATVEAREIYGRLVAMAWENGEPGLFFIDTVNKANPTPALGSFESPNPCAEQPLLPYESCNLGSINLARMVRVMAKQRISLDYDKLRQVVRTAVRFLDNVIDVNHFPLPAVGCQTGLTRKIGLGIMGLADLLILLDLPYASKEAVRLTAGVMEFVTAEARQMSLELGVQRGSFPAFDASIFAGRYTAMRNATVTTIAPTGGISLIGQCSSGIEPLFALAVTRRVLDGRMLTGANPVVWRYLAARGLLNDANAAVKNSGSVAAADLPAEIKAVLATAHEIEPRWHVAHLAAAQRHTDNGVSKTVNLPRNTPLETVDRIFWEAYQAGCKGVTVYRDASRSGQVLTHGTTECAKCEQ